MSDEAEGEKKIVDEDWKSQVEAEKEAAREEREGPETPKAEPSAAPLPPPSLTMLASSLYLQGMVALGLLPNPASDKPEVYLDQAKHTIDMIQMLREKTEGNRTPDETQEMDKILHELRLSYVDVQEEE